MSSTLLTLPPEIQEEIGRLTCNDDTKDFLQLRLTCRDIEAAIRRGFAKTFFTRVSTAVSPEHLASFVRLSKVPDLMAVVKEIDFICKDDCDPTFVETEMEECSQMLNVAFQPLKHVKHFSFTSFENGSTRVSKRGQTDLHLFSACISFAEVILAGLKAGIKPRTIEWWPSNAAKHRFGLDCAAGLERLQQCFSELHELELSILLNANELGHPVDGPKVGQQLLDSSLSMSNLRRLLLELDHTPEGAEAFRPLADSAYFPHLEKLYLEVIRCNSSDMIQFLHRHAATIKELTMDGVMTDGPNPIVAKFHTVLCEIRDNMHLESLILYWPLYGGGWIVFAGMYAYDWDDESDEDGWVEIFKWEGARLDSAEEVKRGVPQMLSCMVYVPF